MILVFHVFHTEITIELKGLINITGLRKHDVAFLITVRPPNSIGTRYDHTQPFCPQFGLTYVRGCEIEGMLDARGQVIEEGKYKKKLRLT